MMDGVREGTEGYRQQFSGLAAVERDIWGVGGVGVAGGGSSGGNEGVGVREGMNGSLGEDGQGQCAMIMPSMSADGDDDERKTMAAGKIAPWSNIIPQFAPWIVNVLPAAVDELSPVTPTPHLILHLTPCSLPPFYSASTPRVAS